ncbi:hypothetical protein F4561_002469 [Lipingzhangella halophila]|uniref:Uncharacterized protein n=1 Tax=Lipingzhangella halophila TaxID=1783352 RepID=A0A7W7W3B8_9ACTN|nr:hypothetical protein [Lipingzhangella halophila]
MKVGSHRQLAVGPHPKFGNGTAVASRRAAQRGSVDRPGPPQWTRARYSAKALVGARGTLATAPTRTPLTGADTDDRTPVGAVSNGDAEADRLGCRT